MDIPQDTISAFILGLCAGINADHKITQAEAKAFIELLRHEPALIDAEIMNEHKVALKKLLKHTVLYRSDFQEAERVVLAILGEEKQEEEIVDALALEFDVPTPGSVKLKGANIVFTGEFHIGRHYVEEIAEALEAEVQGNTNMATNYVVVGSIPSSAWKYGKYGTKVMRALELKEQGLPLQIISEATFCAAVPPDVLKKATASVPSLCVEGFTIIHGGPDFLKN
jgi:NAD-dependent DNA ligase